MERKMKKLILVAGLVVWPTLGFAQSPAAPPMSTEARSAILQRDFQNLATDLSATLEANRAAEALVAKQRAELSWFMKAYPSKKK
jgi:hypothetical protein